MEPALSIERAVSIAAGALESTISAAALSFERGRENLVRAGDINRGSGIRVSVSFVVLTWVLNSESTVSTVAAL